MGHPRLAGFFDVVLQLLFPLPLEVRQVLCGRPGLAALQLLQRELLQPLPLLLLPQDTLLLHPAERWWGLWLLPLLQLLLRPRSHGHHPLLPKSPSLLLQPLLFKAALVRLCNIFNRLTQRTAPPWGAIDPWTQLGCRPAWL